MTTSKQLIQKLVTKQKIYVLPPNLPKNGFATYHVDKVDAMKTTHEQTQSNPLIMKTYNRNETMQHPSIVRTSCDKEYCEHQLCKKPCSTIKEVADVGHATHSATYPGVTYVSATDCSGTPRPEYLLPYTIPIENTTNGAYTDQTKTTNLNNNREALENIHMNVSKEPIKKMDTGSNDLENIN